MECRDVQNRLQAFLDGEVTPEEGEKISAHLDSCAECRAEFEKLRALDRMVAENRGLDPGPEIWERMRANVRRELSQKRRVEHTGIMNWIQWLLSPRYVVVKVGAAMALVVLAFLISREVSVSRFNPSRNTVPESAISGRSTQESGEGMARETKKPSQEIKAEPAGHKANELTPADTGKPGKLSLQAMKKPAAGAVAIQDSEGIEKKTPKIHRAAVDESNIVASEQRYMAEQEDVAKPDRSLDEFPPMTEDTLQKSRLRIAPLEENIKPMLPVGQDQKGEFHFRGGRSSNGLPKTSKAQKQEAPLPGKPVPVLFSEMAASGPQTDSLLAKPFSDTSYWQKYNVTFDPSVHADTGLDSLRVEYKRCEGLPCEREVTPYFVEALFFKALKTKGSDDIQQAKKYMIRYQNLLKEDWGSQRYRIRWGRITSMAKQ